MGRQSSLHAQLLIGDGVVIPVVQTAGAAASHHWQS